MGSEDAFLIPLRQERPRLFRAGDDPGYAFPAPQDPARQRVLANILASCEELAATEPAAEVPLCPDSPHPFHQLYITFYMGMEAGALIEQYSFAWRMTGDRRWLERARTWLQAATSWEHGDSVEEHFYTANRHMQAFAVALDWLAGELSEEEEQRIEACLAQLLERWWPDVNLGRHSPEGGHHAVVDNGHFGVAALQLLGRHPQAAEWVQAVVDRFRAGIMPNGCAEDGAPCDGLGFWGPENAWMLQFCDALLNVTGIDLYREFPERLRRPLLFIRYHLAVPEGIASVRYAAPYANVLTGDATKQLDGFSPVLMRLAQDAGDGELRELALRDRRMGYIHHYGAGVKQSDAECLVALGPYAYLWYDPAFRAAPVSEDMPLARKFSGRCGESVVLRSSWDSRAVVVQVSGYAGGAAHELGNLHVQWAGHPLLTNIGAFEASPVACGNLPSVGGQNEHVALVRRFVTEDSEHTVLMESPRTRQEYRLIQGPTPAVLVAVERKSRGVELLREADECFVRTDGDDYLQYAREPHFNPDSGELRLRVRMAAPPDNERREILFHTGTSLPNSPRHRGGTHVNSFFIGFMGDGEGTGLTFGVRNQRYLLATVEIPAEVATLTPGQWHEITARWGNFNAPGTEPFMELELDGHRRRFDDPDAFGERGRDTQGLARDTARTFHVQPNTVLAFGAPVQLRDSGTPLDIANIRLSCPERRPLHVDFSAGMADETGGGELVYKLNPTRLVDVGEGAAVLGAGPREVALQTVEPGVFRTETVPFYPSGLAASSRKSFREDGETDATRLLVSCGNADRLVMLFAPAQADCRIEDSGSTFEVHLEGARRVYAFDDDDGHVLRRDRP